MLLPRVNYGFDFWVGETNQFRGLVPDLQNILG